MYQVSPDGDIFCETADEAIKLSDKIRSRAASVNGNKRLRSDAHGTGDHRSPKERWPYSLRCSTRIQSRLTHYSQSTLSNPHRALGFRYA